MYVIVNQLSPSLMLNSDLLASDTTHIIDFKKEESDALLKFLFEHLTYSQDCQVRPQWTEDTVVIFDVSKPFIELDTLNLSLQSPIHTRMM